MTRCKKKGRNGKREMIAIVGEEWEMRLHSENWKSGKQTKSEKSK